MHAEKGTLTFFFIIREGSRSGLSGEVSSGAIYGYVTTSYCGTDKVSGLCKGVRHIKEPGHRVPFDTWHLGKTWLLVTEGRWSRMASRLLLTTDAKRVFF